MSLREIFATTEVERLRQVQNEKLVRPAAQRHVAMCVIVMIAVILTEPRGVIVAGGVTVTIAFVVIMLVQWFLGRSSNAGFWMAIENIVIVTTIGAATAVTGGLESPAVPVFTVMAAFIGIRFEGTLSRLLLVILSINALAGVLIADPAAFTEQPGLLSSWIVACIAIWIATTAVGHSERAARSDAIKDALTGLLNRKAFELRLANLERQAAAGTRPVAILMCDLDGFKNINDTLGHDEGDQVLRRVAESLSASARSTDLVYRLGGDEFAVVLDGASPDDACDVGERLREGIETRFADAPKVTLSVGVASGRGVRLQLHEVKTVADRALYEAKRSGRNAVVCASAA
ncbi:MAG: GGDEF domain-containing protein [Solirubrobacteraceae bacterium]|nr:GGDEF domain-containing protein [Solirubrobacteraceae bacterium]